MTPVPEMRCPQAEQSLGWALHALEPAEEAEAAAHLPTCEECRELVRQSEEVLAMLGSSDEMVEPPAELRVGLLARVAQTPQQPASPSPSLQPSAPSAPALPPQPDPTPPPQRRRSPTLERAQDPVRTGPNRAPSEPPEDPLARRQRWRLGLVAAAVAVALGLGGVAIRTAAVEQQRAAETSQTQQLASMVSQLQRPGAKSAMLAPPNSAPVAAVVVVDGDRKLVTVGMMPNPTSTHTYVLWGTGAGPPRPLEAFDVTGGTTGPVPAGSVSQAENFTGYAISLEPGRSAPASPTQLVASGPVQA